MLLHDLGEVALDLASATLDLNMTGDGFVTRATLAAKGLIVSGTATNGGKLTLSRGAIEAIGTVENNGTMTWSGNGRIKGGGGNAGEPG